MSDCWCDCGDWDRYTQDVVKCDLQATTILRDERSTEYVRCCPRHEPRMRLAGYNTHEEWEEMYPESVTLVRSRP